MRIRYNEKSDVLAIVLEDGGTLTKECGEGILVSYNGEGRLTRVEIQKAMARSGRNDLFRRIIFEGIGPSTDPLIILPRLFDNPLQVEDP